MVLSCGNCLPMVSNFKPSRYLIGINLAIVGLRTSTSLERFSESLNYCQQGH